MLSLSTPKSDVTVTGSRGYQNGIWGNNFMIFTFMFYIDRRVGLENEDRNCFCKSIQYFRNIIIEMLKTKRPIEPLKVD